MRLPATGFDAPIAAPDGHRVFALLQVSPGIEVLATSESRHRIDEERALMLDIDPVLELEVVESFSI